MGVLGSVDSIFTRAMTRSVVLFLLLMIICLRSASAETFVCPCKYVPNNSDAQPVHIYNCRKTCKKWDAYMPRPTTFLACVESCETFFTHFAHLYEVDGNRIKQRCDMRTIKKHIQLPQASLPKNAAIDGCQTAVFAYEKCMQQILGPRPGEEDAPQTRLRGANGHVSKLDQLANWRKEKDDPLL